MTHVVRLLFGKHSFRTASPSAPRKPSYAIRFNFFSPYVSRLRTKNKTRYAETDKGLCSACVNYTLIARFRNGFFVFIPSDSRAAIRGPDGGEGVVSDVPKTK